MNSFFSPHCISAFIVSKYPSPRYLLLRRSSPYLLGTWQMVSGSILDNESAPQAALREIYEETSLHVETLYSADIVETFYMQTVDKMTFVPVFVAFVEKGQVKLSEKEHDSYKWLSYEEAKKRLSWAEQKRALTHIHETFILQKPNKLLQINTSFSMKKDIRTRVGVYAVITKDKKLLLVQQQRGPHRGKWDLPGGKIEKGETIEQALHRECNEEIAMDFTSMQLLTNITACSEDIDKKGNHYTLHQIALIYQINRLSSLSNCVAQMTCDWIDIEQITSSKISPLVQQILPLLEY